MAQKEKSQPIIRASELVDNLSVVKNNDGTYSLKGLDGLDIDKLIDDNKVVNDLTGPMKLNTGRYAALKPNTNRYYGRYRQPKETIFGYDNDISTYDDEIVDLSRLDGSDNYSLNNLRGEQQSAATQLLSSVTKMGVLAGTTFAEGTLGLLWGTAAAIKDGKFSSFWDNSFSRTMQAINDWSEKEMANYMTKEEEETPWYLRAITPSMMANFWGESFIKNLGFTIGAMYGGGAWASGVKFLSNIGKGIKAARTAAQGTSSIAASIVGSMTSALGEASIEAITNIKSEKDQMYMKINSDMERDIAMYKQQYAGSEMLDKLIATRMQQAEDEKAVVDRQALEMGNLDFGFNTLILMPSNLLLFGKMFGKGYNTALNNFNRKSITLQKRQELQEALQTAEKELAAAPGDKTKQKAVKEIKQKIIDAQKVGDTMGKTRWREKLANIGRDKMRLKGEMKLGNSTLKTRKNMLKAIATGIKPIITEGSEEGLQNVAASTAALRYIQPLKDWYEAGADLRAQEVMINDSKNLGEMFFGELRRKAGYDENFWEEVFVGALTGAKSRIVVGKRNVAQNAWASFFKDRVGLSGGVVGEYKSYIRKMEQEQKVADYINDALNGKAREREGKNGKQSQTLKEYLQGLVRHQYYEQAKQEALENDEDGKKAYLDSDFAQLTSDLMMFDSAGRMQDFIDIIEEATKVTDEDIDDLITQLETTPEIATNNNGIKTSIFTDENGNLKSKEEITKIVEDQRKKLLDMVNKYKEIKERLVPKMKFGNMTDERLKDAIWTQMQIEDRETRSAEIGKQFVESLLASQAVTNDAYVTKLEQDGKTLEIERTQKFQELINRILKINEPEERGKEFVKAITEDPDLYIEFRKFTEKTNDFFKANKEQKKQDTIEQMKAAGKSTADIEEYIKKMDDEIAKSTSKEYIDFKTLQELQSDLDLYNYQMQIVFDDELYSKYSLFRMQSLDEVYNKNFRDNIKDKLKTIKTNKDAYEFTETLKTSEIEDFLKALKYFEDKKELPKATIKLFSNVLDYNQKIDSIQKDLEARLQNIIDKLSAKEDVDKEALIDFESHVKNLINGLENESYSIEELKNKFKEQADQPVNQNLNNKYLKENLNDTLKELLEVIDDNKNKTPAENKSKQNDNTAIGDLLAGLAQKPEDDEDEGKTKNTNSNSSLVIQLTDAYTPEEAQKDIKLNPEKFIEALADENKDDVISEIVNKDTIEIEGVEKLSSDELNNLKEAATQYLESNNPDKLGNITAKKEEEQDIKDRTDDNNTQSNNQINLTSTPITRFSRDETDDKILIPNNDPYNIAMTELGAYDFVERGGLYFYKRFEKSDSITLNHLFLPQQFKYIDKTTKKEMLSIVLALEVGSIENGNKVFNPSYRNVCNKIGVKTDKAIEVDGKLFQVVGVLHASKKSNQKEEYSALYGKMIVGRQSKYDTMDKEAVKEQNYVSPYTNSINIIMNGKINTLPKGKTHTFKELLSTENIINYKGLPLSVAISSREKRYYHTNADDLNKIILPNREGNKFDLAGNIFYRAQQADGHEIMMPLKIQTLNKEFLASEKNNDNGIIKDLKNNLKTLLDTTSTDTQKAAAKGKINGILVLKTASGEDYSLSFSTVRNDKGVIETGNLDFISQGYVIENVSVTYNVTNGVVTYTIGNENFNNVDDVVERFIQTLATENKESGIRFNVRLGKLENADYVKKLVESNILYTNLGSFTNVDGNFFMNDMDKNEINADTPSTLKNLNNTTIKVPQGQTFVADRSEVTFNGKPYWTDGNDNFYTTKTGKKRVSENVEKCLLYSLDLQNQSKSDTSTLLLGKNEGRSNTIQISKEPYLGNYIACVIGADVQNKVFIILNNDLTPSSENSKNIQKAIDDYNKALDEWKKREKQKKANSKANEEAAQFRNKINSVSEANTSGKNTIESVTSTQSESSIQTEKHFNNNKRGSMAKMKQGMRNKNSREQRNSNENNNLGEDTNLEDAIDQCKTYFEGDEDGDFLKELNSISIQEIKEDQDLKNALLNVYEELNEDNLEVVKNVIQQKYCGQ